MAAYIAKTPKYASIPHQRGNKLAQSMKPTVITASIIKSLISMIRNILETKISASTEFSIITKTTLAISAMRLSNAYAHNANTEIPTIIEIAFASNINFSFR